MMMMDCNPLISSSTTSNYVYRGTTTYVCDQGYEFISPDKEVSPKAVNVTCLHTSEWWPQIIPPCRKVSCPAPLPVKNGYFVIKVKQGLDDSFAYGDVISYECIHGYILSGEQLK